ncbi:MAG TPA: group 1 truncated hemoglobin [Candidatus Polarisedimenticolia bacterium]|nr:group 1 truncated hemoglobin [Candidatus Polarisedimenticolia bacterium]
MLLRRKAAALALAALMGGQAAVASQTREAAEPGSLFERLGGMAAITAIVDELAAGVASDQRLSARFQGTDMAAFKKAMSDWLCRAAGGPCAYEGKDMKTAHAGMGITGAEFNAFLENLTSAMTRRKVSDEAAGSLIGAMLPSKREIVEKE